MESDTTNRKRPRDDSECDSHESKLIRVHLSDLDGIKAGSIQGNEKGSESNESAVNSPKAKRIQDDLFYILDDSDEPAIQGLDSVIRSFEEEIIVPISGPVPVGSEVISCGDGSQPDLGYLLEASDDELGLPPTISVDKDKVIGVDLAVETSGSGAVGFCEMIGFEDQMPSYDSFEFGLTDDSCRYSYNDSGDFMALGGLFDYSDENCLPADISGVMWQPESLHAL